MKCPKCDNEIDFALGAIRYCNLPFERMIRECYWMGNETRDPLFEEREKTHGSFKMNANISQELKSIIHGTYAPGQDTQFRDMCEVHREALDMIALKLSRILSGQANFKDHWDDIAGYAKLASEACDK